MVAGVFYFNDRDEWDGSCFKMQVKLNYDHNHEMTSSDEGCSTEKGEECHDVPGLKCSVDFSEQCSDVEREVCHDEMKRVRH